MHTPTQYDLLALDVDGTLIGEDHELSLRLRLALDLAHERGTHIVLCTGRPLAATLPLWESLHLATPPVVFNGALVPALDGGEPLVCQPLPGEALSLLIQHALTYDDFLEVHTARDCYVHRLGFEGRYQRTKLRIQSVVSPLDKLHLEEPVLKAQYVIRTEEQRQRIVALGPRIAPWAELSWGVSPGFDGHFVNVMRAGVDKSVALDRLLAALSIPWSRVFAAGDSPSDLSYVNRAGYGVIMGNAPEAVRRQAPHVAPSVAEDGLAKVLESVVLANRR